MQENNGFIEQNKYLEIIKNTQIMSTDLLIFNPDGEVLLGKRLNKPAKNSWFVPGGKVRKYETLTDAVKRVSKTELGLELSHQSILGVYNHIYTDNFQNDEVGTHYVCFAVNIILKDKIDINKFLLDDQHSELKWWNMAELLTDNNVHMYTKNYFHPTPWNKEI